MTLNYHHGRNFSNNSGGGLAVWSYNGNATLNNVTATGNDHGAFAHVYNGNVTVNGGNFSNNAIGGLWATSSGVSKFNNVTAVGNGNGNEYSYGAGAYGNLDVVCGNYSANRGYGLWLGPNDGVAYLGGPILNGNSLGGYYLDGGTVSFGLCGEEGAHGFKAQNNLLPQTPVLQIVAETKVLTLDQLPAGMPEGKVFASELTVKLVLNGQEVDEAPNGGHPCRLGRSLHRADVEWHTVGGTLLSGREWQGCIHCYPAWYLRAGCSIAAVENTGCVEKSLTGSTLSGIFCARLCFRRHSLLAAIFHTIFTAKLAL